jgi:hypothetical protein
MKLWLDDERPAPVGWKHVKTAQDAIWELSWNRVEEISLDHDLGDETAGNGYIVACYIERYAREGSLKPLRWSIHSANPIGRGRMLQALNNADKSWSERIT